MEHKKTTAAYKLIRGAVKLFYPRIRVEGVENLPQEAAVIVGNHTQMNGPIACELYMPGDSFTWCAGEMMHWKDVPGYAFRDFWSQKPKYSQPLYKLLSYLITPVSVCVFNNANTIGVYHDTRILSTFKTTVQRLSEGANVVIFPEHDVPYNHIVCQFQDKFIDVARLYHRRTGKALPFVPMYIAPKLKTMYLGKPTYFQPEAHAEEERQRISKYLMDEITRIACELPEHTVVPYRNIPRRLYPTNIPKEKSHEKTGG